jgi:hypothetical protein
MPKKHLKKLAIATIITTIGSAAFSSVQRDDGFKLLRS